MGNLLTHLSILPTFLEDIENIWIFLFSFFFIYHAYLSAQKNYRDIFQLVMPCFKRFWLLLGRKIPVMPILEVYSPTSQEIADFSNVAKLQKCVSW